MHCLHRSVRSGRMIMTGGRSVSRMAPETAGKMDHLVLVGRAGSESYTDDASPRERIHKLDRRAPGPAAASPLLSDDDRRGGPMTQSNAVRNPDNNADVIVVGAGPAGATAATYLARSGVDVLLLEKSTFPRDKVCGDGLTPRGVKQVLALGVDVSGADWIKNKGLRVVGGGNSLE